MAQLRYTTTAAPNFGDAAEFQASAARSFNSAFAPLQEGLLAYDNENRRRNDAALIPQLAALRDEGSLDAFLANGGLDGKRLSPEMQATILGLRNDVLNYGKGRADIGFTNAQTDSVRGQERRTQDTYDFTRQQDLQRAALAGNLVGAREDSYYGRESAPSASANLIAGFEDFRETPYWDVNALRTGFGSDTVTLSDGTVQKVTEGTRVSREDAARDLNRRINEEFRPSVINAVGEDVYQNLNENQKAVLDSLAYNYGAGAWSDSLKGVAAAVKAGDFEAATSAIQALGSHNDGINRNRRNQEAALFAGQGSIPGSSGSIANDPNLGRISQFIGEDNLLPYEELLGVADNNFTARTSGEEFRDGNRQRDFNFAQELNTFNQSQQAFNDQNTALAAAISDLRNPNNANIGDTRRSIADREDLTPTQKAIALDQANQLAGQNPELLDPGFNLNPDPALSQTAEQAAADSFRTRANFNLEANETARINRRAENVGDDPALYVAQQLNLDIGPDRGRITQQIQDVSRENGISPAQAAVLLTENSYRGSFWGQTLNPLNWGDGVGRGEVGFDVDAANEQAARAYSSQGQTLAADLTSYTNQGVAALDNMVAQQAEIGRRIARQQAAGQTPDPALVQAHQDLSVGIRSFEAQNPIPTQQTVSQASQNREYNQRLEKAVSDIQSQLRQSPSQGGFSPAAIQAVRESANQYISNLPQANTLGNPNATTAQKQQALNQIAEIIKADNNMSDEQKVAYLAMLRL